MKKEQYEVENYVDVLLHLVCENPSEKCFFGVCEACPKNKQMSEKIEKVFQKNNIENISHKQWVTKPKTTLEKRSVTVKEFVKCFCEAGRVFLNHYFIANKQGAYYKLLKKNIKDDEILVTCDFAENYAFVIQNSITGFHWNNDQSTIFPIVFYYKKEGKVEHQTIIMISDCKKHDAVAVYVFLKAFHEYLSIHFSHILRCFYFSDGAPQQFKNVKHFSNIYFHENDFGRKAEWHFHATAHGKGPCDGAGGAIKRMARRASLQMTSEEQISTPLELFEWASKKSSSQNMSVLYRSTKDYEETENFLKSRFEKCKTITGTQGFHSVVPQNNYNLKVKTYSSCHDFKIVSFFKNEKSEKKRAIKKR